MWVWSDTLGVVTDDRPCARCGKRPTLEGYDACLGYIPQVVSACCGHGKWRTAIMVANKPKRKRKRWRFEYNKYRSPALLIETPWLKILYWPMDPYMWNIHLSKFCLCHGDIGKIEFALFETGPKRIWRFSR